VNGETMPPKPDLISHTLSSFLDRFVYRNAKATAAGPRGSSIMQPLSSGENGGVLLTSKAANRQQQPVNSEAFWRKKAEDVAVDEVFFHKYFTQIGKSKQSTAEKKTRKTAGDSDDEEAENEDEIWQALVDSRPEVEGGSDEDSDMEMLDLDDSDTELSVEDSDIEEADDNNVNVEGSDISDSEPLGENDDSIAGSISEEEEEEADLFAKEVQTAQNEAGPKDDDSKKSRRKKLKSLPTFASVDDYAEMLDNDEDEDMGT
jgi:ribosome biogenesis protein MAK21